MEAACGKGQAGDENNGERDGVETVHEGVLGSCGGAGMSCGAELSTA
jgi:hypothetical protein